MPTPSRNDPCPCGSGRKYKKCCALQAAALKGWTPDEHDAALDALFRFLEKPQFDELFDAAWDLFWPEELDDLNVPDEEIDRLVDDPVNADRFLLWLALDRVDPEGPRPVDVFLERERHRLTPGGRLFLERLAATPMRLYQILRVDAGVGLEVRDVLSRRTRFVRERLGTTQFVRWDLLATRLIVDGDGKVVIDGSTYLLAAGDKPHLLKGLARIRRHLARNGLDVDRLFDTHAVLLFHHTWLARVALRPKPRLVGPDGEPVILCKTVYRVPGAGAFRAWLSNQPGLEAEAEGESAWAWVPDRSAEDARLVATVKLGPRRMIVMAFSTKAAERTRTWLATAPAGLIEELFTREYEPGKPPPARTPLRAAPATPIDPDVEAEIVGRSLDAHYREWIDVPVPALGALTPREAARDPRHRRDLRALLEDFESHSARDRREGRPAYDFTWMWVELGLRR